MSHGHPDLFPGGGEIAAYQLFRGLRDRERVEAVFVAAAPRTLFERENALSSFSERPDEFLLTTDMVDFFHFSVSASQLDALAFLVRAFEPDVIHVHHYIQIGLEALAVLRTEAPKARIVLTLHEFFAICHHNGQMVTTRDLALCRAADDAHCARCFPDYAADAFRARRLHIQSLLQHVDRFIAPSWFLRDRYVGWGLQPEKISVLDNVSVDLPTPSDEIRTARNRAPRCKFAFFGQVTPYKGLLILLHAFTVFDEIGFTPPEELRLDVHAAYLDLNTPRFQEAVKVLVSRARGRVRLCGAYSRSDLPALMQAADWIVVPSTWWENSPLVIEEALGLGRPVICSDVGGMAERVRHDVDGLHFRVADSRSLAVLIARLCDDTETWDRLRRTMRRPSPPSACVEAHVRLYGGHCA